MSLTKTTLIGLLAMLTVAPVWGISIASCGYVITAPGNYVVTADLTCTGDGIDIQASNVTLNLNGHIITHTGSLSKIGVSATPSAGTLPTDPLTPQVLSIVGPPPPPAGRLDHVGIFGPGLIRGFAEAVDVESADFVQVNQVTVTGGTIFGMFFRSVTQATITYNVMTQNTTSGLTLVQADSSTVTGNQAVGNNGFGIWLLSGGGDSVSGNTADGNTLSGIVIGDTVANLTPAGGARVWSNTTVGNGASGILATINASGSVIFSNTSSVGNAGNDLQDDNAACGTNYWNGNVFFTHNQPCVK